MGLDQKQTVSALGLAGAQASGLMEMYGPSMQKRFNPGPAARNGVTAAQMARLGYTGAATIFEGERGFCRVFTDEYDVGALTSSAVRSRSTSNTSPIAAPGPSITRSIVRSVYVPSSPNRSAPSQL